MTDDHAEIPMVGRLEESGLQLVLVREQVACDRRIEDWIASNLERESDSASSNKWNRLIDNLPADRRMPQPGVRGGTRASALGGWSRFNIAYRRGITVVRIVDNLLVQQSHLQELGSDLMDLIEVGNHRILLNFTAVERLGSWIIGAVGNAYRRCALEEGGALKI
jgi:hypothetical protein